MRERERGWRTVREKVSSLSTVALRCEQREGNIDIFIFPLNLICVMDELPAL